MPKQPTISQINWLLVPIQLAVYVALVTFATALFGVDSNPVLIGAGIGLAYSFGSRACLARDHKRGIKLLHSMNWDAAIPQFEESYSFFSRHSWLDRFRALFLMSPSGISYREMALANVAFCHTQAGRGAEGRRAYERILAEFPESQLAHAALRMLDSANSPVDSA